jgi:hypothetical protein
LCSSARTWHIPAEDINDWCECSLFMNFTAYMNARRACLCVSRVHICVSQRKVRSDKSAQRQRVRSACFSKPGTGSCRMQAVEVDVPTPVS